MDAIVSAGGVPVAEDRLYPYTQGRPKAMVDVAGKAMVQWVLDALSGSKMIDNVIVVGLTEKSGIKCRKPLYYVPNQGKMLDNLRAGARKVLEINKKAKHALLVSSDIPTITPEMVDWVVRAAMKSDEDVYYNVIQREVMEKRFPGSKRTWTRLKDMQVCGGDMNVGRLSLIVDDDNPMWEKITDARKSPLKQASLIGMNTAIPLLFRQLTLEKAVSNIMKRLDITGQALVCPYAEIGMDVDKPHQLEMLRADLKKRLKKAEKAAQGKGKAAAATKKAAAVSLKGISSPKGKKPVTSSPKGKPAAKSSPKGTSFPKGKKPTKK
jgi:GTP:adenosylcobinamide-phosphate guanylyltransferase